MNKVLTAKIKNTIKIIREVWSRFENREKFIAFSTGKDSLALTALMYEALEQKYHSAQPMKMAGDDFLISALPLQSRARIFQRLETIARQFGIAVKICACKNPELSSAPCSIAGEWNGGNQESPQPSLFQKTE